MLPPDLAPAFAGFGRQPDQTLQDFVADILTRFQTGSAIYTPTVAALMAAIGTQNPTLVGLAQQVHYIVEDRHEGHVQHFTCVLTTPDAQLRHQLDIRGIQFGLRLPNPFNATFAATPHGVRVEFHGVRLVWGLLRIPIPPVTVRGNRLEVLGVFGWEL